VLLKTLLDAGILSSDAKIMQDVVGSSPPGEFLDGLEQTARVLATKMPPGLLLPSTEPWQSITRRLRDNPNDLDQAFGEAVAQYDNATQVAIVGAVMVRVRELQEWMEKQDTGAKRRKWAQYIQVLNNLGYKFKYNMCTNNVEVNGEPIHDLLADEIDMRASDAGVWQVNVLKSAYRAHAWQNRYHPIRDYLRQLKFEGGDPISELANYFVDEHGIFAQWLRRWLVGSVARVMSGAQNRMLILDSEQGLGKSEFVKWLASPAPEYYHEGAILPDDKDCRLKRSSVWIWEVDELGATTRRADREALKSFVSARYTRERKAYGHYDTQTQNMASFAGTVNNESGILNDPTGSRRFLVCHLLSIDWSYVKEDVDQVWAQAYDLYVTGEKWDLSDDEIATAEKINKEYEVVDIVEETIRKHFYIDPTKTDWWLPTTDIMDVLKDKGNLKAGTEIDTRRLSAALTHLGLGRAARNKADGKLARGYYGISQRIVIS